MREFQSRDIKEEMEKSTRRIFETQLCLTVGWYRIRRILKRVIKGN